MKKITNFIKLVGKGIINAVKITFAIIVGVLLFVGVTLIAQAIFPVLAVVATIAIATAATIYSIKGYTEAKEEVLRQWACSGNCGGNCDHN